jgi:hypothetical protein
VLRLAIRLVTLSTLVAALAVSVWWWTDPGRDWLQAPSTALALVAAVTGIPADRWAGQAQARARAIAALRRELAQNQQVLLDPRFQPENQGVGQVYPRLMLGAVDTALVSGALNASRDRNLVRQLLDWRNAAEDLNRRLEITELRLCIVDVLEREELVPLREMLGRPDGYFAYTGRLMHELAGELDEAGQAPAWLRWLPAPLLGDAAPRRPGEPLRPAGETLRPAGEALGGPPGLTSQ